MADMATNPIGSDGTKISADSAGAQAAPNAGTVQKLSVLIPIYNEEENIAPLMESLFATLDTLPYSFEIIAVNDGSTDDTLNRLQAEAERRSELKIVEFRRNYGQTAAIMAAIDHASGDVLISIDADLQNDPRDIPLLIEAIEEGYDVVSGWRRDRQDAAIRRNFISRVANSLISAISGVRLNDYGCTLKAYRRDVIEGVRLYGEMHRFIPIYAVWMGAKVTELPVRHHPRKHGRSNYGLERVAKVILDLIVVMFLDRFFVKPIYVFGGFGLFSLALSGAAFAWMLYLKLAEDVSFVLTPLPLVATMTFLVGFISILMGLLAEIMIRVYFESQGRKPYWVRRTINFDDDT